eukprot:1154202-Pelagomonas_calceolata.AAC.8
MHAPGQPPLSARRAARGVTAARHSPGGCSGGTGPPPCRAQRPAGWRAPHRCHSAHEHAHHQTCEQKGRMLMHITRRVNKQDGWGLQQFPCSVRMPAAHRRPAALSSEHAEHPDTPSMSRPPNSPARTTPACADDARHSILYQALVVNMMPTGLENKVQDSVIKTSVTDDRMIVGCQALTSSVWFGYRRHLLQLSCPCRQVRHTENLCAKSFTPSPALATRPPSTQATTVS